MPTAALLHVLDLSALEDRERDLIREQVLTVLRVEAHDIRDVLPGYAPGAARDDMAGWLKAAEDAIAAPPSDHIDLTASSPMMRYRVGNVVLRALDSLRAGARRNEYPTSPEEAERWSVAREATLAFLKGA